MTILTPEEINTPIWKKIREEFLKELKVARKKNDGDLDDKKTASLRGEIRTLKKFLDWDKPAPKYESEDSPVT